MTSDSRASAAPHVREPGGFWEWCAAVDDLVREDGTQATAHAWALHCVTWRGDECRLRTPHVGVEELARRRSRDRTAIRRHLVALEALGLLELVQRHGHGRKRLYLARVPLDYGAPGEPLPLPGVAETAYRAAAPGKAGEVTGQQRPDIPGASARIYRAAAPGSPSLQRTQNSSRPAGVELPGSSARLPAQEEELFQDDEASHVVAQLRRIAPAVLDQADVPSQARMRERIDTLLVLGWQPDELARELTRVTLDGTHRPVGVLLVRLDGLVDAGEDGLRQLHAEQAARQARRAQQGRVVEDEGERAQRVEADRWAEQLAAAMAGDELGELLDLIVAEHHPELAGRGPASMRRGVARAWLLDEYRAGGEDSRDLAPFLVEVRAKLARALDDEAAR